MAGLSGRNRLRCRGASNDGLGEPTAEFEPIALEAIADELAPGGSVARAHPGYEDRPAQREMARAVANTFNNGGILLVEAGTGTGKSIAYLLPALRWAGQNRERTVVSTNTINLQEQLVYKDLPFLQRALGEEFRFALVKGRQNYVSLRRALLAGSSQGELFGNARREELARLLEWAENTTEGSLQDLPWTPDPLVWNEVVSDADACMRKRCPFFERCHYQRARRTAASADVLVVNHHLLISDLAIRAARAEFDTAAVLPPFQRLVIDEAHNLEDLATVHLGRSVSRRGLISLLSRLDRRGRGVLGALAERLKAGPESPLQEAALGKIHGSLKSCIARVRERGATLFQRLGTLETLRIEGIALLTRETASEFAAERDDMLLVLGELTRQLEQLCELLGTDPAWRDLAGEQLLEIEAMAGRIVAFSDSSRLALESAGAGEELVCWLQRTAAGNEEPDLSLHVAPVEIGPILRELLFQQLETVVLTSATLATEHGFDFIRDRLGLAGPGMRVKEQVLPETFDFAAQTLLAVPTDLPGATREECVSLDIATAMVVEEFARLTDGGLLVLFTSYRAMRSVADRLRCEAGGQWPVFVQGEAPRFRIATDFVRSGRAILLGVASFWEGIDLPGDGLRGVVVQRLPFKVPSEPLTVARVRAIEDAGGSGFNDFMLPHAALRLKQGFGRLIRSRQDRGAILLLDARILNRTYGGYLLRSLPPAPLCAGRWAELVPTIRQFYAAGS